MPYAISTAAHQMRSDCRDRLYGNFTGIAYTIAGSVSHMRLVLNASTNTVHKPASDGEQPANCGALRHVADDRIRMTTEQELEPELEFEIDRCGRCFEDYGGY